MYHLAVGPGEFLGSFALLMPYDEVEEANTPEFGPTINVC
jgi:hypothetical protein